MGIPTAILGHEDQFLQSTPSGCCVMRKKTVAGSVGTDEQLCFVWAWGRPSLLPRQDWRCAAHLRTPSLRMRARALATVRVWKIWLERQARPRSDSRDAYGLPAMAGAGSQPSPRHPQNAPVPTYKTRRKQPFLVTARYRAVRPEADIRYALAESRAYRRSPLICVQYTTLWGHE